MFSSSYVFCRLRLFKLKTKGQTIETETTEKLQNSNSIYHQYTSLGPITNCPHENACLASENEFWQAANHIALALLLIGQQGLIQLFPINRMSLRKPFKSAQVFHFELTFIF